jgi:hypothetical protein
LASSPGRLYSPLERKGWDVMPVSSAVRKRLRGLLEPGEEIRYVFPANGGVLQGPYGAVGPQSFFVVTQTSITVVYGGWFSRTRPKKIWRRLPRNTCLGPVDTSVIPTFTVGNSTFEIDDEYVAVVNAVDAEIGGEYALPPDPDIA